MEVQGKTRGGVGVGWVGGGGGGGKGVGWGGGWEGVECHAFPELTLATS